MKKLGILLSPVLVLLFFGPQVYADNTDNVQTKPKENFSVQIYDPNTGLTEQVELNNNFKITKKELNPFEKKAQGYSLAFYSDEKIYTETLEVSLGEELAESFGIALLASDSGSNTKYSDVNVTAGLTYGSKASNNTVIIYNAFGSTVNKGLYYVSNRAFYWRNPWAGTGGPSNPTTASWNYSVTDYWAGYVSQTPPYAITDATVSVSGMSATRTISAQFNLTF